MDEAKGSHLEERIARAYVRRLCNPIEAATADLWAEAYSFAHVVTAEVAAAAMEGR